MALIILDRDGVINYDADDFVKSPDEWTPIPGSLEAIARLSRNGYRVVVASNQSGLARRLFDIESLNSIHQKMHRQLAEVGGVVEAIFFCPHGSKDGCECRKPRAGLFREIAARLHISMENVPAVGDSQSDIEAARNAGAKPVLVLTGKGQETLDKGDGLDDVPVYRDLAAFVEELLGEG
ncbi:MAG: D-glycero-beta-D-manno-heptose 1,7-bisphosphate 7-phosphatase [Gammaproteobacteria bacterium]|nr:D-glycero-beta-D-manno-heptose 1,7-bisphosphate 7-phosphatase [Gammaproteobacteria bacterium]MCI0590830.1 D-glycero-beta-D-manno-heptose 1,7-bisphosphate 7-phosphatase [Gammaproteobacteria bacterium]